MNWKVDQKLINSNLRKNYDDALVRLCLDFISFLSIFQSSLLCVYWPTPSSALPRNCLRSPPFVFGFTLLDVIELERSTLSSTWVHDVSVILRLNRVDCLLRVCLLFLLCPRVLCSCVLRRTRQRHNFVFLFFLILELNAFYFLCFWSNLDFSCLNIFSPSQFNFNSSNFFAPIAFLVVWCVREHSATQSSLSSEFIGSGMPSLKRVSNECLALLNSMLAYEPHERPTIDQVV